MTTPAYWASTSPTSRFPTDKAVIRIKSRSFFLNIDSFDDVIAYIAKECAAAGCDEDTIGHITIASSEILANIDSYAYENGGKVEILTRGRDRRMTIVFKDNGPPFNPLQVAEPDVSGPLSQRRRGGLGIFIVRKLMRDVRYAYENGQNVMTIETDF